MAWLRIAVGILFLILAQYKIIGAQFIHGRGFENWIHQFLRSGAYPFMAPILRSLVLPHATAIAYLVSYGELCIGLGLLLGILVRPASFFGFVYMAALLFSSNYPGSHAAIWEYFSTALNHLVLALCFVAFGMANAARVWSVPNYYRRKLLAMAREAEGNPDSTFIASNTFGK